MSSIVRSTSNPQQAITSTSGAAASNSSSDIVRLRSPSFATTSVPPASRTSSGVQCPQVKSGSSHSSTTTRGRSPCSTRSATAWTRARSPAIASRASPSHPAASPTIAMLSNTCSSVSGSRFTTRGWPGRLQAAACTSASATAQTSQSACVTSRSGRSSSSTARLRVYSALPVLSRSRTSASMAPLAGVMRNERVGDLGKPAD